MRNSWYGSKRIAREWASGCYFCGGKYRLVLGTKLEDRLVHHIDCNRDNNEDTNLVVLCGKCHGKLHNRIYKKLRIKKD